MAARKKDGESVERAPKTLLQRATAIVKILEPCTAVERARVMTAVEALSVGPVQTALPIADTNGGG